MEPVKRNLSLDLIPGRHHRSIHSTPSLVTPTLGISTPELNKMIPNIEDFPLLTPNGISSIIPTTTTATVVPSPLIPTTVNTSTPVTNGNNTNHKDNPEKQYNYGDQNINQKQRNGKTTREKDYEKIEKKRERNRLAAKKCRQRKMEIIEELKNTVMKLEHKYRSLDSEFTNYKSEASRMIEQLTLENATLKNLKRE